jgi:hypothetical protein
MVGEREVLHLGDCICARGVAPTLGFGFWRVLDMVDTLWEAGGSIYPCGFIS